MQAGIDLDHGITNLSEIISAFPAESEHWNEAQNRFQFVDRLLMECLGWQKPNISVEQPDGHRGRSDYLLGHNPVKAILEAKREAVHFEVPPQPSRSPVRRMAPLLAASRPFKEAVTQVITYCALHGAQIAIVCNGPQLAIFQAIMPGYSPLSGECYFFNGFQQYIEEFPLIWRLLSPEGITENYAYRALATLRNPRLPPKASVSIPEPFKYRYRNSTQEELRQLSSFLLEEIEDNPELKADFYRECYIPIEANNRNLMLSRSIIESRYKRVANNGISPEPIGQSTSTHAGRVRFNDSTIATQSGSRPVVVVGDVGVGKTSFFENLFLTLTNSEKNNTYYLHLDLGTQATLTTNIHEYIVTQVERILRESYDVNIRSSDFAEAIYYRELQDFDSGVEGQLKSIDLDEYKKARIKFLNSKLEQRDRHLQTALGHLAHGRKIQIILVLDNADQREFALQQKTFLIAQEFAATRNLLVFISLRPSTFYLSKTTGSLAAYQNKLLTISPPPADAVVQKRIIFALRVAEGKISYRSLPNISLQLDNVVKMLSATARSIKVNSDLRQFLSNISGGNTRSVVELITGFLGSPNVDSKKIVTYETRRPGYRIPLHEFTKHALLGEYAYYNAQSSQLACNVFDIDTADPREHFLQSLIVGYLGSNLGARDSDGFVLGGEIITGLAAQGFIEEQINRAVMKLASKRLIETPHAHYREIEVSDGENPSQFHFRTTSVGNYHIRHWSGSFAFLDAVSIDTPILEETTRTKVADLADSFRISDRLRRTKLFRDYLESQWHTANFAANYYDFPELIKSQSTTFESVESVVRRPRS